MKTRKKRKVEMGTQTIGFLPGRNEFLMLGTFAYAALSSNFGIHCFLEVGGGGGLERPGSYWIVREKGLIWIYI